MVSEKIEREKREKAERELASFEYETHADGTDTPTGVKGKTAPRPVPYTHPTHPPSEPM